VRTPLRPAYAMNQKRAVFLDRDGTLNRDVGYPADWSQVHLYPFAFDAVRRLREAGLAPVVVTNQEGVGRGFFGRAEVERLHGEFAAAFERAGSPIDAFYYCPHVPPAPGAPGCGCAKPAPGLGLRAAAELGLELAGSYMVGDKATDVLFGRAIGAVPILVLTGYGRRALPELEGRRLRPDDVAADLAAAVDRILERERGARQRNGARP